MENALRPSTQEARLGRMLVFAYANSKFLSGSLSFFSTPFFFFYFQTWIDGKIDFCKYVADVTSVG
jgi:hypothetical protein